MGNLGGHPMVGRCPLLPHMTRAASSPRESTGPFILSLGLGVASASAVHRAGECGRVVEGTGAGWGWRGKGKRQPEMQSDTSQLCCRVENWGQVMRGLGTGTGQLGRSPRTRGKDSRLVPLTVSGGGEGWGEALDTGDSTSQPWTAEW